MTPIDLRRFPLFALLVWTWCGTLIPDCPVAGLLAWTALLGWHVRGGRVWVAACALGLGAGTAWMHAATPLLRSQPKVRCTVKVCSLVKTSTKWHRPRHTLHLLAGCAWLQLLHCPTVWTEVGFQLSYAAVAGIVLLEPVLKSKSWQAPRALRPICGLVRVALAAQLATTPFALYHFHQFPTWFLISSVLVVPAATLLLAGGLALLASSGTSLAPWLASGLDRLCEAVGRTVGATSDLPHAVLSAPAWSGMTAGLWLLGLALFWRWRQSPGLPRLRPLVVIVGVWACMVDVRADRLPQIAVVADKQGWELLSPAHTQVIWKDGEMGGFTTSAVQGWLGTPQQLDIKNAPVPRRMESGVAVVSWVEEGQRRSVALIAGSVGPEALGPTGLDAVVSCVHLPWRTRQIWYNWCEKTAVPFWPAASGKAWLSSGAAAPG